MLRMYPDPDVHLAALEFTENHPNLGRLHHCDEPGGIFLSDAALREADIVVKRLGGLTGSIAGGTDLFQSGREDVLVRITGERAQGHAVIRTRRSLVQRERQLAVEIVEFGGYLAA